MASAVKTRKMTAHKGQDGKKVTPHSQRSPPKITKYTFSVGKEKLPEEGSVKASKNAMPTPSRTQTTSNKVRGEREQVREDLQVVETEDSESDDASAHSDDRQDISDQETEIPFACLGELEQSCQEEIDPRQIVLNSDNIPLVLLSFLTKIEKLEEKQTELEMENSGLKGSLDFAYGKIDDLEKNDRENAETIQAMQTTIESIQSNSNRIKVDADRNRERNIKAEAYSRRSNLRFEGIPAQNNETNIQCRNKVYEIMKKELGVIDAEERIVIEKCHRDKKFPKQDPPSILVRFLSLRDRQEIWEKRDKLNKNRQNKLFVNEDFPQEVERKRAFLRPYLKAAYANNRKATMSGDTLIVDSEKYTVETLHLLPEDMRPEKTVVKTKGNVTAFFRSDAFLSNFHPSQFEVGNRNYCCVEQFYMSKKAERFNDYVTRNKIMSTTNPREINYLSKHIANFNQENWNEISSEIMATAVNAKFEQNRKLQDLLMKTGNSILAEASPTDKEWGVGIAMSDERVFDQSKWLGSNKLGKILMACRDRLRN